MDDSRVTFAKVFSKVLFVLMGIGVLVGAIYCWHEGYDLTVWGFIIFFAGAIAEMVFIMFTQLIISIAENAAEANDKLYTMRNKLESIERNSTGTPTPMPNVSDSYRRPANGAPTGPSKISGLSGMWKCRKCGESNPASSTHCQSCGEDR